MRLKDSYSQMLDHLEKEVEKFIQDIMRLEKENLELKARVKQLEEELSNAK
jgi:cell division septum initiation protein DivIVA